MWYFRRQARRRFKRILSHVHRLQVFDHLESWEAEQLAAAVVTREVAEGTTSSEPATAPEASPVGNDITSE